MQMTLDWNAVGGILAFIAGLCTGNAFVIRAIVRTEITKINGTYLRAELAHEQHQNHERRLESLERYRSRSTQAHGD